jgi:hypothetical protein
MERPRLFVYVGWARHDASVLQEARSALKPPMPGALLCATLLTVVLIVIAVQGLGSSPFQWAAIALGPMSLMGFLRPQLSRDTGTLLARSGVVLALLTAQLEFASGRLFWDKGAQWLLVGFMFALIVLLLHLSGHAQRIADDREARAAAARSAAAEAKWREEVLKAVTRRSRVNMWPAAAAILAGLLLRRRR